MRRALPAVAVAVLVTVGCSTDSADLGTGELEASIVVVSGERDSQVTVVLSADDMASVELADRDTLTATSGEVESVLDRTELAGSDSYAGRLEGVVDPSTQVTVALSRGGDDEPAPTSVVELPGPIFVVEPKPGERVSRRSDLTIGANQGVGTTRVEWTGSCVLDGSVDVAEGEPVVVPAGSLESRGAEGGAPDCTTTLTVSRIAVGDLDPAYGGGTITAQRSQSVSIESVP